MQSADHSSSLWHKHKVHAQLWGLWQYSAKKNLTACEYEWFSWLSWSEIFSIGHTDFIYIPNETSLLSFKILFLLSDIHSQITGNHYGKVSFKRRCIKSAKTTIFQISMNWRMRNYKTSSIVRQKLGSFSWHWIVFCTP